MKRMLVAVFLVLAALSLLASANDEVTLTIIATGDGTVVPPPGDHTYSWGDTIEIQITSDTGGVQISSSVSGSISISISEGSGTVTVRLSGDSWISFDFGTLPNGPEEPEEPEEPEPVRIPMPDIRVRRIEDDEGNVIGGRIRNQGTAPFAGTISFSANLALNPEFGIDTPTRFAEGDLFEIVLPPREEVEFFFETTEDGHPRFYWPEIEHEGEPFSFTVSPPSEDSDAVERFRWQLYVFLHNYVDSEPDTDYMYVSINADSEESSDRTGFFFPLPFGTYFDRPEGREEEEEQTSAECTLGVF